MFFDDENIDSEVDEPVAAPEATTEPKEEKVDARFLVEKDKALKEERKRRKEAESELDKLRQASTQTLDPAKIAEQVRADLKREDYQSKVDEYVGRLSNLTPEEQKQLREQIELLPKTGNVNLDADFALQRLRMLNGASSQSSTMSPMSMGAGASNFSMPAGSTKPVVSSLAKEYGKTLGQGAGVKLTDKDYERFDGKITI